MERTGDGSWQNSAVADGTPRAANNSGESQAVCGNGTQEGDEECDDGNISNGDGCSSECMIEVGPICGNGTQEGIEECDDGNNDDGDGCSASCVLEFCGDSIVNGTDEVCDNNSQACTVGDYAGSQVCNATCDGWETCVASEYCGDGVVNGTEECDDENTDNGDGCSSACIIETALSARAMKEAVRDDLENSKTGDEWLDDKIDQVLEYLDKSLNNDLWVDDNHVNPKTGLKVFYAEFDAVIKMQDYLDMYEQENCESNDYDSGEWYKNNKNKWKNHKHGSRYYRNSSSECHQLPADVVAAFNQAIKDLVEADRILAETILTEAKNLSNGDLKYQRKYGRNINRAEVKYNKGIQLMDNKPEEAMDRFDLCWQFSGEAIMWATEDWDYNN